MRRITRPTVFRILAGVLAVVFAAFLALADTSGLSLWQVFGMWGLAFGFGLHALGSDLGERFLALLGGGPTPGQ